MCFMRVSKTHETHNGIYFLSHGKCFSKVCKRFFVFIYVEKTPSARRRKHEWFHPTKWTIFDLIIEIPIYQAYNTIYLYVYRITIVYAFTILLHMYLWTHITKGPYQVLTSKSNSFFPMCQSLSIMTRKDPQ